MRFKRLDQARPFATLGVVVLIWLVLPAIVKSFFRASFFELTAPITIAASHVHDLQDFWSMRLHSKTELIEAGRDLARLSSSYELAVQQNAELQNEIARLQTMLRLPAFNDYRYEHARVARREFSAWWQSIVIRKGKDFGITVGAPVVFSGGVVGRVTAVHATTSEVELISSPNVRLAGVVEGDTHPISFQGGVNPTFGPPMGVADFVPLGIFATPSAPKRIVTSGLGGVFPPGLTLGMLTKLQLGADGLFQSGEVRLDDRLGTLTEVTVLVPLNPE